MSRKNIQGNIQNNVTVKEIIFYNMPPYPIKKAQMVQAYGMDVTGALNELMKEGKLVRVKRGYYSLADKYLDEYDYSNDEQSTQNKPLLPTETLKLLLGAWCSQFTVSFLLTTSLEGLLEDVPYYTTTSTGTKDERYQEELKELLHNLTAYRLTDEGEQVVRQVQQTLNTRDFENSSVR